MNSTDPFPDFSKKIRIHPALHITQYNIRSGILPGIQHLHMKIRAADPAADQCRVDYYRLHKSILGSPKHLILIRFLHPSGRIGSGIDQHSLFITVHQQDKHS